MYPWKEYWASVARSYGQADAQGFAAVLHPDAPGWFNRMIDRLQEKAWRRGFDRCGLRQQSPVLDVGCGTGRWVRRYVREGMQPVGMDATETMLRWTADAGAGHPLVVGRGQALPFRDGAFELASAITVIQHIPPEGQRETLSEMARVVRPGGYVLLLDLIRGEGPHIFPHAPEDWIEEARLAGLSLVSWTGQEYLIVDRAFVWCVQLSRRLIRTTLGRKTTSELPARAIRVDGASRQATAGRRLYWTARRITCQISEWAEPLAAQVCSERWATHGLFVFQKRIEHPS